MTSNTTGRSAVKQKYLLTRKSNHKWWKNTHRAVTGMPTCCSFLLKNSTMSRNVWISRGAYNEHETLETVTNFHSSGQLSFPQGPFTDPIHTEIKPRSPCMSSCSETRTTNTILSRIAAPGPAKPIKYSEVIRGGGGWWSQTETPKGLGAADPSFDSYSDLAFS